MALSAKGGRKRLCIRHVRFGMFCEGSLRVGIGNIAEAAWSL